MSADGRIRVYEQGPLVEMVGDTIRPGGLALTDHALALCDLPSGARVLDVGCGPAATIEHLITQHHFAALGIDPSALLLHTGQRRHPHLPLVQSRGEHLPVASGQLDVLIAECSLSVVRDTAQALREFWRVLRVDGYLILSDVYARNPDGIAALRRLPLESCFSGAMAQTDVIDQVQSHGFTIKLWEDHTRALRSFTAQMLWEQGSIQQFWCRATSCADASDIQTAIAQSKPGYYLLIARKNNLTPTPLR